MYSINQLCYTRGAAIPCVLDIECKDRQALDLLASPKAIVVQLRRRVRFFLAAATVGDGQAPGWNDTVEDLETAVWWPGAGNSADPCTRRLEGEIRLSKDLKPTSAIAHFSVSVRSLRCPVLFTLIDPSVPQYSVVMHPFETTAFASIDTKPLLAEPVEIATMYGRGPRPRAFSPPSYETAPRRSSEFHGPQHAPLVSVY